MDEQLLLPFEPAEDKATAPTQGPGVAELKKIRNEIADIIGMVERL